MNIRNAVGLVGAVLMDESDQSLSAPGGGSWHVGDRMKVHVAKVDFRQRRIDFMPVRIGRHG